MSVLGQNFEKVPELHAITHWLLIVGYQFLSEFDVSFFTLDLGTVRAENWELDFLKKFSVGRCWPKHQAAKITLVTCKESWPNHSSSI